MLMDRRKCTQCDLCTESTFCSCIDGLKTPKLKFESLALSYKVSDDKPISISWFKLSHQHSRDNTDIYLRMLF